MSNVFKTPGVYREEIDLSDILIPTGISDGAIVVRSPKGPINRPVLITNDKEYIETFGEPVYTSGAASGETGLTNAGISTLAERQQVPDYGYGSYAALEFLKESSQLQVVRGWSESDKFSNVWVKSDLSTSAYEVDDGTSATSADQYVYGNYTSVAPASTYSEFDRVDNIQALENFASFSGCMNVFANNPSVYGDDIAITIEPFSPWADWRYSYDTYPSNAVAASATTYEAMSATTYYPIADKVFKVNVFVKPHESSWDDYIDKSGKVGTGMDTSLSGTQALASATDSYRINPVETFYGSLVPIKDVNNNELWIESVINGNSKYIYVKTNLATSKFTEINDYNEISNKRDNYGLFIYKKQLLKLANGASYQATGIGSIAGWSGFEDKSIGVSILINPDWSSTVKQEVARISSKRLDCIAVGQVGSHKIVSRENIKNAEGYGYTSPSYMALYSGFSRVFDVYNNKFIYLPNAIFGASLFARIDRIGNPWDAPAGTNRAILPVLDQNKIWSDTDIGELYDKNINCVKFIRGTGFVMWGQKTAQMKKSALDRINVRRLLLYIENNIERSLNQFLFENNTDKTRLRVYNIVDEFLKSVYAGGGLTGYKVVCDETNNTSQVIDSNQLNVDIYVQPVRTIEYIKLTTVVTRTGISFSEVLLQR